MKILCIIFIYIFGLFPIHAMSFSSDDVWYVGGRYGLIRYYGINFYSGIFNNCVRDIIVSSSKMSPSIFFGYRADQYLGFELACNWLGNISYKIMTHQGMVYIQDIELVTKLCYPLIDSYICYTKLGCSIWRINVLGVYNDSDSSYKISNHDVGISPLISAGVEYRISNTLSANFEYQLINKIGNVSTVGAQSNGSVVSCGLIYYF